MCNGISVTLNPRRFGFAFKSNPAGTLQRLRQADFRSEFLTAGKQRLTHGTGLRLAFEIRKLASQHLALAEAHDVMNRCRHDPADGVEPEVVPSKTQNVYGVSFVGHPCK